MEIVLTRPSSPSQLSNFAVDLRNLSSRSVVSDYRRSEWQTPNQVVLIRNWYFYPVSGAGLMAFGRTPVARDSYVPGKPNLMLSVNKTKEAWLTGH